MITIDNTKIYTHTAPLQQRWSDDRRDIRPFYYRHSDRLQHVLNDAAARVITGTRKFDRGLSDLLHSELHWLDIYRRVRYKLRVTIYRCLQNRAPQYLGDC